MNNCEYMFILVYVFFFVKSRKINILKKNLKSEVGDMKGEMMFFYDMLVRCVILGEWKIKDKWNK